MYIKNGIAYADNLDPEILVRSVRALDDHLLLLTFTNGERKTFDFKPLLGYPVFVPLRDEELFRQAYVDYGAVTWDERIDIAPETLYENGVPLS
jgi:hypothetical protein